MYESDRTDAAFYFAAEEYIMRELRPSGAALILWSTGDTVMIGANQVATAECDLAYMKSAGIGLVRRPSGGGAIFTDRGTLQYTFILPYTPALPSRQTVSGDAGQAAREWLAEPAIEALAALGIEASLEGRNDITIAGKKVSGLAQHVKHGYICSHGSLLIDTDLEKLARALTVDSEKIKTKAIASVRARVTNVADELCKSYARRGALLSCVSPVADELCKSYARRGALSRRAFSPDQIGRIEEIMRERYLSPGWTFGRDPAFTFTNKRRFPGGSIEVFLDVKGGVIREAKVTGDFLALRPIEELEGRLEGVPHREDALTEALRPLDVESYLGSLGARELLAALI